MAAETLNAQLSYDPGRLLDAVASMLGLTNDVTLAAKLEVPASLIVQIRRRGYPVGPSLLIRMNELTTLSMNDLRNLMGDRRKSVRTSYDRMLPTKNYGLNFQASRDTVLTVVNRRNLFLVLAALICVAFFFF